MHNITTDVDIDVFNRDLILSNLDYTNASIDRGDVLEKHKTGVYFQDIPKSIFTNMATIGHKEASTLGYFKIDFLNINFYENIKDEDHLIRLLNKEPQWELFEYTEITDQLFQLNGHSKLLQKFKPSSVEDLAMILALIRPAKAYLQKEDWDKVRKEVWDIKLDTSEYSFKRQHSISYALAIIINLNLLIEGIELE